MLAILSSSHFVKLSHFHITRRKVVRTPYGEPSCALTFCETDGHDIVFLARHGYSYFIPPHEINYRANIWALSQQKIEGILAIISVSGIRTDLAPGTLVIPDQIIDYTWGRRHTFFDANNHQSHQVDFTDPYSPSLRKQLLSAAHSLGEEVVDGGVCACTQGPRLESAAEIRRIERDGGDMVSMTGMPEAGLARELNIPYAALAIVSNWAAGKTDPREATSSLTSDDLNQVANKIQQILVHMRSVSKERK